MNKIPYIHGLKAIVLALFQILHLLFLSFMKQFVLCVCAVLMRRILF